MISGLFQVRKITWYKNHRMDFSFEKNQLLRRISSKSSPDDIQKWREQRKMLFVTKANLELKQRQEQVLFERGERIKKSDNLPKFNKNHQKRIRSRSNSRKREQKPIIQDRSKQSELNERKNDEIKVKVEQKQNEPVFSSGLTLLLNSYSVSSESELEDGEIKDEKLAKVTETKAISNNGHSNDEQRPQKPSLKMKADMPSNNSRAIKRQLCSEKTAFRQQMKIKRRRTSADSKDTHKSSSASLLRRLLSSEIQHERNMILQCVCFIVKNDFFDCKQAN